MSDYPRRTTPESAISNAVSEFRGTAQAYPQDVASGPGIILSFQKYSYTAASKYARGGGDSIFLPLPQQLQDAAGINVGSAELGSGGALAADSLSGQTSEANLKSFIEATNIGDNVTVQEAGNLVINSAQAVKYFNRSAMDSLFAGAGLASDVINGSAINPHATLNFDGVNLKEYQWDWQFAPRNPAESDRIAKIVQTINKHIHPKYSSVGGGASSLNRALLEYPSLITAKLRNLSENHFIIYRYPMMAKNFSVDYSPQGNATVAGGKPAFVNISLSVQESKIHTREDYGG